MEREGFELWRHLTLKAISSTPRSARNGLKWPVLNLAPALWCRERNNEDRTRPRALAESLGTALARRGAQTPYPHRYRQIRARCACPTRRPRRGAGFERPA